MINHPLSIGTAWLLAFVIAFAITDLRTRRIPNLLTVSAALVGLALNVRTAGSSGAMLSLAGLLTGLGAFLPFYLARGFGAGDVKAMAAIGAFLGGNGALLTAGWILMAGAIGGVLVLFVRGGRGALQALARRWFWRAYEVYATGRAPQIQPPAHDSAALRFPYGMAIACGTCASIAWS
ncbi:MAG: prepilin peptidase [Steroidobacteraceae bacterium]